MKIFLPLLLCTSFLILETSAQTRLIDRRVNVHLENIPFEVLLGKLRSECDINILYSIDRFKPSRKKITLDLSHVTVRELMTTICHFYNLKFECTGNFIMLTPDDSSPAITVVKPIQTEKVNSNDSIFTTSDIHPSDTIPGTSIEKALESDSILPEEIKTIDTIATRDTPTSSEARPKQRGSSLVMFSILTDFHHYHFTVPDDKSQNYSSLATNGFALSLLHSLNKKFYAGIGITYSKKAFTYNRNLTLLEMDDPVSIPDKTRVSTHYLEIPVELSYQLFRSKLAEGHVITGFTAAVRISNKERTNYLTYGKPDTNYLKNSSREILSGASFGLRASLHVVKSFSLFIEPRYQKLFYKVNTAVMTAGADLMRLNTGLYVTL